MKNQTRTLRFGLTALIATLFAMTAAHAQIDHEVVDEGYDDSSSGASVYSLQSTEELEDLVGPIALYPDDLVSIILPAATYPVQVVQAARFLRDREGNPDLQPPADWDDAVVALLNYPEVIEMMNDDLDWTWALGDAFLNQQSDVLAAVADFRDQAYAAGNLKSDEHQIVRRSERVIEIEPVDPEVIYVPYYEPERVIIYQPYPVYYYHPYPRYSYYYPYPANYGFSYGYFFGVSTAYRLHWVHHRLYTYHYGYHGHPYFGRGYNNGFYYRHRPYRGHRPRLARSQGGYVGNGDLWKPRRRHGPRPRARSDARNRGQLHTNAGGRIAGQRQLTPTGKAGSRDIVQRTRGQHQPTGQHQQAARSYSDKNPDQRHLLRRYREDANNSDVKTRRPSAGARQHRAAGNERRAIDNRTDNRTENRIDNRHALASTSRNARTDKAPRVSQGHRSLANENARDLAVRGGNRSSRVSVQRRPAQSTRQARTTIDVTRPSSLQRAAPPMRTQQAARSEKRSVQTRQSARPQQQVQRRVVQQRPQAAPARSTPPPRQARPARAEERPARAKAERRTGGGRRAEPRRR